MIEKFQQFLKSTPGIMFICGLTLYIAGYLSVMILGPHNIVEELVEVTLQKEFNIKVEFENN